jgi:hypothetical protein
MLQTAASSRTNPPIFTARASSKIKRPALSALERAIAEHKSAAQTARARDRSENKLLKAHPDLAESCPKDDAGRRDYNRRRRSTGLVAAQNDAYRATMNEQSAFKRLVNTVPSTQSEVRRYARYVYLVIENRVGGSFNPEVGSNEIRRRGGLEVFETRSRFAFYELYKVIRAFAKRTR